MLDRPRLEGGLVVLEPLELGHVPGLLEAAVATAPSAPFTYVPETEPALRDYVEGTLARWKDGRELPFAVIEVESGDVVGTTRFLDLDYWPDNDQPVVWPPGVSQGGPSGYPDVAEIGSTWLAPAVHGSGHNVESKLLMLTFAFDTWNVVRVSLKTDARNARSRQAIERLGARFEGIRRAHVKGADGTVRDSAYFSILANEWPECRQLLHQRLDEKRENPTARHRP